MPEYEFKDDQGQPVTLYMSMAEAPSPGETIEHDGRTLTRVFSNTGVRIKDHAFVSNSLEQWHPDATKFNKEGQPVFESRRDREDFLARNAANPNTDNVVWDG